jgi:hypothetical protein
MAAVSPATLLEAATCRHEDVMSFLQIAVAPHFPGRWTGEESRGVSATVSLESTVTFW